MPRKLKVYYRLFEADTDTGPMRRTEVYHTRVSFDRGASNPGITAGRCRILEEGTVNYNVADALVGYPVRVIQ